MEGLLKKVFQDGNFFQIFQKNSLVNLNCVYLQAMSQNFI